MAKWFSYDFQDIERFCNRLCDEEGYTLAVIDEGCLGLGQRILIAPDDRHYHFLIREVYLNEWSSDNQMMKVRRIPKAWANALDEAWA